MRPAMLGLEQFGRDGWGKKLLKPRWVRATNPVHFGAHPRRGSLFMMAILGFYPPCIGILVSKIGSSAGKGPGDLGCAPAQILFAIIAVIFN